MAHQKTAALRAAIELDLFRAVGEGPADAATLAARCGASERGTRILCDYLTIIGLLLKSDGLYSHSPTSAAFLDPRSPSSVAATARFLGNPAMLEPYLHLADIVRNGRTNLPGEGSVEPENPVCGRVRPQHGAHDGPHGGSARFHRACGAAGPMQVLDIAAGHGLFGIEIAKRNPQARIVALDWAAVLQVAAANAAKAGVAGRYEQLPGSAFDVDYGGPYDLILLTNFLHHFDDGTCVGLLEKVRSHLKPGGRVAALEFGPDEDRISPPMAAGFSLTMLASTVSGDAYTFRELESMYQRAGFKGVTAHQVRRDPTQS